jgi:hypothetical protein
MIPNIDTSDWNVYLTDDKKIKWKQSKNAIGRGTYGYVY